MVDINIQATVGSCDNFMSDNLGEPREVSVVIAPLRVTSDEDSGKINVVNGCNMWQSCFNEKCWYSKAAREIKKT